MDHYAVAIYFLAGIGWLYAWRAIVGYDWLRQVPLLWVAFIGCLFVLAVNIFLAFFSSVPDFATELPIYNYVETNATTVAGLTLAIAIFVVVTFDKEVHVLGTTTARKFLWLTLWAFLFAVVGCLPLYWVPERTGWLTVLRHLKTVPFTYSLFILSSAMIVFLYETRHHVEEEGGGGREEPGSRRPHIHTPAAVMPPHR